MCRVWPMHDNTDTCISVLTPISTTPYPNEYDFISTFSISVLYEKSIHKLSILQPYSMALL